MDFRTSLRALVLSSLIYFTLTMSEVHNKRSHTEALKEGQRIHHNQAELAKDGHRAHHTHSSTSNRLNATAQDALRQRNKYLRHPCGGAHRSSVTRPCASNDTYCGSWSGRWWTPQSCGYRDITPEEARVCVGNRTIACLGDSQVRDICAGVANFLMGINSTIDTSRRGNFQYQELDDIGTIISDYPFWKNNVPPHNHNGYIIPKIELAAAKKFKFQIQMWSLYRNEFIDNHQADDVMSNRMVNETANVRPIDFLLWNHGLHDDGWFDKPPHGENFYGTIFQRYLTSRLTAKVPVVWVSMNSQCAKRLNKEARERNYHVMVDDTNKYLNEITMTNQIPYWDADALLRVPDRCDHLVDNVHVHMYVDLMRAKMLFNHLCDGENKWRGGVEQFL